MTEVRKQLKGFGSKGDEKKISYLIMWQTQNLRTYDGKKDLCGTRTVNKTSGEDI